MLITLTTTHAPATDLGYLLHKHPDRCQTFPLAFGQAHVFYPEATAERCTAALLLDVDPVGLVRGKGGKDRGGQNWALEHYVNDRPYVASSFLSVAIARIFGSALSGNCKDRPALVEQAIPLSVSLPVLPCRGGESFLRQLFEPLGYEVEARSLPLNEANPDWGESIYLAVTLDNTLRLQDLLSHLYVLIPVLDSAKHYWVNEEEIEKLLRHGEGWLQEHPMREAITRRYLKRMGRLSRMAIARLSEADPDPDETEVAQAAEEEAVEKPISLNQQRLETVGAVLQQHGVRRLVDVGCGEGNLLRSLLPYLHRSGHSSGHSGAEKEAMKLEMMAGMDVSYRAIAIAQERLKLDQLPTHQREKIQLFQGSLIYRDARLQGYDAATVVEVIEHMDLNRLAVFERVLFEFAQPPLVVVTTPNVEYNVRFENLPAGKLRHRDHRFEWTRQEFQDWAQGVAERFGYGVGFQGIGNIDAEVGTPTQMGVFQK